MMLTASDNEQAITSSEVGKSLNHIWFLEVEFLSIQRKEDLQLRRQKRQKSVKSLLQAREEISRT